MANPEHLKILEKGIKAWNKWRKQNPNTRPDLRQANLSRGHLGVPFPSGANLRGADLHEANLSEANLYMANLQGANLREANLSRTYLAGPFPNGANLSGANLRGANLREANFWAADLRKANLRGADLHGADLRRSNLWQADVSGLDLEEVNLREANFNSADLHRVVLRGANLSHLNFWNANLSEADLSNANLTGAFLLQANLQGANLRQADLTGAFINNANLSEADLRGTRFTPEGEPIWHGSFLGLCTCNGLETARFSNPDFLDSYLSSAFEYAHRPDTDEAKNSRSWLGYVIENIRALRALLADEEPPEQLIEVVRTITAELIEYVRKHPKALYQIKPRQFEELIAEILASYGWDVQLTPPIKDGGYDIFAISRDDLVGVETSWIIECKKYAPENKVGVDIVRALYGVKSNLKVANALLATTSFFTKGVMAFKASRYNIELKDYRDILEWINQYRPNPNGKLYIKDNKLILPEEQ